MDWDDIFGVWVIGVLVGFILFVLFFGGSEGAFREQAIKAGVAEYYLDDKHERQFRWKEVAK